MKCYSRVNVTLALLLVDFTRHMTDSCRGLDVSVAFFTIKIRIPSPLICTNFSARRIMLNSFQIRNIRYFVTIVFT
jgi:hypothetical protein